MSLRIAARIEMRSSASGGRQHPFFAGGIYRPIFRVPGANGATSLIVNTILGKDSVEPGEVAEVDGWLFAPDALDVSVGEGTSFTLSEGLRQVGSGVVLKVLGSDS